MKITVNQFGIAVLIFCVIMIIIVDRAAAQAEMGFHIDYSAKYHAGGGIEAGTWINNSYIGGNTLFYTNGMRKNPVSLNAKYGYNINGFIPFIIAGYYTSGNESVKDHEGIQGFLYGAGLSYKFRDIPIKLSIQQTNLVGTISFGLVHSL